MRKVLLAGAALASLASLSAPAFAQTRGETTSADAAAATNTRARLAVGDSVSGVVGEAGDLDWYRVTFQAGETYRISLNNSGESPVGDPYLRVLDSRGNELASDDDSGGNLNSYIEYIAPSRGTFYIEAKAFSDGATGGYTLSLGQGEIPGDATTDVALDAQSGAWRQSTINQPGDTDWFRMQMGEGESVRLSMTSGGGSGAEIGDPFLAVYDAAGTQLVSDDDGGDGLNSYIEFLAPAAGTYFVEARGFSEEATGDYTLNVTSGEIGGEAGTGEVMQANSEPRTSRISPAGDRDAYSLEMIEGRAYRFNLTSGAEGGLPDPYLSLVDGEGGQVAADDDGGTGFGAYLTFVAPATGTYTAIVSAFADGGEGTYELRVSDSEVPGNGGTDETLTIGADGDSRVSRIDMPGDKDWFNITLEAGAPVAIAVNGYGPNPLTDPVVAVLGESGEEIATDDDSGEAENALMTFTPQQSGNFVVQVTGYGQLTGEYELSVNPGPAVMPEPPRPTRRR